MTNWREDELKRLRKDYKFYRGTDIKDKITGGLRSETLKWIIEYHERMLGIKFWSDDDVNGDNGNKTTNPTTIIEKDGIPREVQNEPRIDRLRLDNYARLSISSVAGARAREFGDIVGSQDDSVSARFFLMIENPDLSSEEIDAKLAQMNADEIREKARIYNQITQVQTQNRAVGGVVGDAEKSFYSAVESM